MTQFNSTEGSTPDFPLPNTTNTIFDLSHHNSTPNFAKAKAAGMTALFHKATEGLNSVDETYTDRKRVAQTAGLLWGAYHFGRNGDGAQQADHFLNVIGTKGDVLPVLDFEDAVDKHGNRVPTMTMTLDQAVAFVERIKERTGKYPGLYSGSLLNQEIEKIGQNNTLFSSLKQCWIWWAAYTHKANVPAGWQWTLWQYTDGTHGPWTPLQADGEPQPLDGIGICDRSLFNGSETELATFWNSHTV